jgi:hypothetical protein
MNNVIFKNNTMTRILSIELLNTILILVFNDKNLSLKLMVYLENFIALFSVPWVEKGSESLV